MKGHIVYALAFGALALILTIGMAIPVQAQDLDRDRVHTLKPIYQSESAPVEDGAIYGHQLMSLQEQDEYRTRMRSLSEEEQASFREAHQRMMQERAKALGIPLGDEPSGGEEFWPDGSGSIPEDLDGLR